VRTTSTFPMCPLAVGDESEGQGIGGQALPMASASAQEAPAFTPAIKSVEIMSGELLLLFCGAA
jgi:hypothetical protein